AGRGRTPDQALESDPAARRADQTALRAWRPNVSAATAPSLAALGLRQPQDLKRALVADHPTWPGGRGDRVIIANAQPWENRLRSAVPMRPVHPFRPPTPRESRCPAYRADTRKHKRA